jgi:hypothetical protein
LEGATLDWDRWGLQRFFSLLLSRLGKNPPAEKDNESKGQELSLPPVKGLDTADPGSVTARSDNHRKSLGMLVGLDGSDQCDRAGRGLSQDYGIGFD